MRIVRPLGNDLGQGTFQNGNALVQCLARHREIGRWFGLFVTRLLRGRIGSCEQRRKGVARVLGHHIRPHVGKDLHRLVERGSHVAQRRAVLQLAQIVLRLCSFLGVRRAFLGLGHVGQRPGKVLGQRLFRRRRHQRLGLCQNACRRRFGLQAGNDHRDRVAFGGVGKAIVGDLLLRRPLGLRTVQNCLRRSEFSAGCLGLGRSKITFHGQIELFDTWATEMGLERLKLRLKRRKRGLIALPRSQGVEKKVQPVGQWLQQLHGTGIVVGHGDFGIRVVGLQLGDVSGLQGQNSGGQRINVDDRRIERGDQGIIGSFPAGQFVLQVKDRRDLVQALDGSVVLVQRGIGHCRG